jgi:hypothetical protein
MRITISLFIAIALLSSCTDEEKKIPKVEEQKTQAPEEDSKEQTSMQADSLIVDSMQVETDPEENTSTDEVTLIEVPNTDPQPKEIDFDNIFDGGGNSSNDGDASGDDGGNGNGDPAPSNTTNFHAYIKLNSFLKKYVSYSGNVNYAQIKSNKTELNNILKEFQSNYPSGSWSKNQKLAYWINAYNIYTIKLVVDNYPTTSITKITEKPWHKKFIKLGGKTYSLDNIENDIIRKQFNEPRIHFALNCASKSCPILMNSSYVSTNLDMQLTKQTRKFLADKTKNILSSKKIQISKIFEWYKADFDKVGGVVSFIEQYSSTAFNKPAIQYMPYSWDLNK